MRLNDTSQRRIGYEQVKTKQNCRVSFFDKSFNGPCRNCSSLARIISLSRGSFLQGPEGMPILILGQHKHPPTKIGSTIDFETLSFENHLIFKINKWLFMFLFLFSFVTVE